MNGNELDWFDKLIAGKLIDHQATDDLSKEWTAIERGLRSIKRRKTIRSWLSYSAAAVAIVALSLFGLRQTGKHGASIPNDTQATVERVLPQEETTNHQPTKTEHGFANVSQSKRVQGTKVTKPASIANSLLGQAVVKAAPIEMNTQSADSSSAAVHLATNERVLENSSLATGTLVDTIDFKEQEKIWRDILTSEGQDSRVKWQLAAGLGGAFVGNQAQMAQAKLQADFSPASIPMVSKFSASMQNLGSNPWDGYDDVDHSVPLSFGLTVRRSINQRWSLESGLVYTFLSSKFSFDKYWANYSVTQDLHYIGVPIGLAWNAWDRGNWSIYLIGGGMLEKGVWASYHTEEYFGSASRSNNISHHVSGIQLSIYGAAGINYRLFKGIGLYFEPRVSYYFDNGQPVSIRSDWPVTVGAVAGFRLVIE